jgi:hypothetical protein
MDGWLSKARAREGERKGEGVTRRQTFKNRPRLHNSNYDKQFKPPSFISLSNRYEVKDDYAESMRRQH